MEMVKVGGKEGEVCEVMCQCSDRGNVLYMKEWVRRYSSSEVSKGAVIIYGNQGGA